MTNPPTSARAEFSRQWPEETRQVNGRQWGAIRAGTAGPGLVLLPGTLGRADIFWQQITALHSEVRILSLSYPGSGELADWAGDIATLIETEGLTGATVLGSSLGGYVAQFLTASFPGLCKNLIAANTLPDVTIVHAVPPYALDLQTVPIETLRAGFLDGLQNWVVPDHPYADLARLLITEVEGRIPEAELRARLNALKTAPPLPKQSLPQACVFTVESDDDHLIPAPVRTALRNVLVPHRAYRFREASHFPYVTRPAEYTHMLREVLSLDEPGTHWPAGKETVL